MSWLASPPAFRRSPRRHASQHRFPVLSPHRCRRCRRCHPFLQTTETGRIPRRCKGRPPLAGFYFAIFRKCPHCGHTQEMGLTQYFKRVSPPRKSSKKPRKSRNPLQIVKCVHSGHTFPTLFSACPHCGHSAPPPWRAWLNPACKSEFPSRPHLSLRVSKQGLLPLERAALGLAKTDDYNSNRSPQFYRFL